MAGTGMTATYSLIGIDWIKIGLFVLKKAHTSTGMKESGKSERGLGRINVGLEYKCREIKRAEKQIGLGWHFKRFCNSLMTSIFLIYT
jgi:hypothetical protein